MRARIAEFLVEGVYHVQQHKRALNRDDDVLLCSQELLQLQNRVEERGGGQMRIQAQSALLA